MHFMYPKYIFLAWVRKIIAWLEMMHSKHKSYLSWLIFKTLLGAQFVVYT